MKTKTTAATAFATLLVGCTSEPALDETSAGARKPASDESAFTMRVVATGLEAPWEITLGPDGMLWITERVGRRIVRMDPTTGARAVLVTIEEALPIGGQEGVLGMALSPTAAGDAVEHVYVGFTYDGDPTDVLARRAQIRRYSYDAATNTLAAPLTVIADLPANNDHNGGRLKIAPDGKLHYTIGEGGANQFGNKCKPIRAQELPTQAQIDAGDYQSYLGKTLRLDRDGSIPVDNPIIGGVRSHILTYGHRNPQGIAFAADGTLYGSEHGPKTDDEINLLRGGRNYGWPHIAGFRDDKAYVYGNWSAAPDCEQLVFSDYVIPPSVPIQTESSFSHPDLMFPLATLFTVASDFEFQDPACGGVDFICWPTVATSSIDVYEPQTPLPGWQKSLVVPSLKRGSLYVAKLLSPSRIVGAPKPVFRTINRYRDVAISSDGGTFYVITDSSGFTGTLEGGATNQLANPGAVLAFTPILD
jgi:PQQ-dependent dehydrogenase (s-GDH family)